MRLMVSAGALQLSPVLSKEKPYTCSFLAQFTQLMSLMLLSSSTLRSSVRSVLLLVLAQAQASLVLLTWHKNQEKQNQKIKKRCIFLFVRDEDYGLQATQCMLKLYFIFGFKITTHYFGSVVKIQDQRLYSFFSFSKNISKTTRMSPENYKRISLCLLQVSLCRGGGGGVRINGIGGCWGLCFCDPCYQHFDEKIQMNGDKTSRDPAASTSSVVGRRRLPQLWPQCWRRPMRSFLLRSHLKCF